MLAACLLAGCSDSSPLHADLGVDESAGLQSCNATFSGDVVAYDPACAVTATYASAAEEWTLSTNGNSLPVAGETWTGVRVTVSGAPAIGTYDASETVGVAAQLSNLSVAASPVWVLSSTAGSLVATVDGLGPFDDLGAGNRLYATPHGRIDATLVDETDLGASSVQLAVTF